jgi:hypothetical protein
VESKIVAHKSVKQTGGGRIKEIDMGNDVVVASYVMWPYAEPGKDSWTFRVQV